MNPFSVNNKLVLAPYTGSRELRKSVSNGFASVEQKQMLVGLEVLVQATLSNGEVVPAGSKAYINEATLFTGAFAKKVLTSDTFPGPFMVVELSHIEYIVPPISGEVA